MNASDYIEEKKVFFDSLIFDLSQEKENLAIIIETREIENFGAIVKNHLHFLPDNFGLLVCHSNANANFVESELEGIDGYYTMTLPFETMTGQQYNKFIASFNFWRVIDARKVVIFQTDSLLLRNGIEKFMEFDFIGAPLFHIPFPMMNGGLSIRDVGAMKKISEKNSYDERKDGNEDMYFCKNAERKNLPTKDLALQFSVETIFFPNPIGIHACDKWLKPEQSKIIFEKALNELA